MLYRIDNVTLPEAARAEFEQQAGRTVSLLRRQPGFVRADRFEKIAGPGKVNVIIMAVWKDQESIDAAATAVQAMHEDSGFDPAAFRRERGIVGSNALYALRSSDAAE
ncbi:MAG: antibiotic biosynthesis monooxygenase [Sphingosinicella sp.]|nr:antibiotic biosynthesis monooxygenase [Sphingosinicella sp.]